LIKTLEEQLRTYKSTNRQLQQTIDLVKAQNKQHTSDLQKSKERLRKEKDKVADMTHQIKQLEFAIEQKQQHSSPM
jgi:23S rRNA maturation-related 3'-5' exoribonuclease YhaM